MLETRAYTSVEFDDHLQSQYQSFTASGSRGNCFGDRVFELIPRNVRLSEAPVMDYRSISTIRTVLELRHIGLCKRIYYTPAG